jgi:hypothetical protein
MISGPWRWDKLPLSLAGKMTPLQFGDVGDDRLKDLWLRRGFSDGH